MNRSMKKGIGGIIVSLIMITSIAAVIPMAAGTGVDCLEGYKYNAATDEPIAGWTINITYIINEHTVEYEAITDEHGHWEICGLSFGDYVVTEESQEGWTQVLPLEGSYTVTLSPYETIVPPLIFTNVEVTNPGTGTPGYWKNHPKAWPVDEITIGDETYNVTEAIAIMNMPDKKDKTITMFRALVAAKLNVWIGNDDSCIADTITAADAWMGTYGPESGVKAGGKDSPWRTGEPLSTTLGLYNNGDLCAPSRDDLEKGKGKEKSKK